jgi:hypothetical protein
MSMAAARRVATLSSVTLSPYRRPTLSPSRRAWQLRYLPAAIVALVLVLVPLGIYGLLRGSPPGWKISAALVWLVAARRLLSFRQRQ